MSSASELAARLSAVRTRIVQAARAVGRAPDDVCLIAVSKFHPVEAIRAAYAAGQREFGENYAQELADKAAALADLPELRLHFIGGLQRNKAKLLVGAAHVVQTVASEPTAEALHARASTSGVTLEVMLQVNVLGEPQKAGVSPGGVASLVEAVRRRASLALSGLMTIPPAGDPALAARAYGALATLAARHGLRALSMGMSDDLELAIGCGATHVRVGTAIFGPRPTPR